MAISLHTLFEKSGPEYGAERLSKEQTDYATEKRVWKKAGRAIKSERWFNQLLTLSGLLLLLLVAGIFITLVIGAMPSLMATGAAFFVRTTWNPVANIFGAYPFFIGTLLTSFLALAFSIPFAIAIAISLGEYFRKGVLSGILTSTIELIAAVPSVIFGFWGFFVLVPFIRMIEIQFGFHPTGVGIFPAAIVLSIMIIPYAASIGATVIKMVPADLKEGAYALGATRWEVLKNVILPYSKSGIYAGILLSLGRAIGETMAVTMVIGNANIVPKGLFSPGNTMASVIANEFSEADHPMYLSALIELGLFLFLVTFVINIAGKKIIKRNTFKY